MKHSRMKVLCHVFMTLMPVLFSSVQAKTVSVELWPAERRANNTLYVFGNDWNSLLITLDARDLSGQHKIEIPEKFTGSTVLSVSLPKSVEFLGADIYGRMTDAYKKNTNIGKNFKTREFTIDNKTYVQYNIPLNNDLLTARLCKNRYTYNTHVWCKPPEVLNDTISWELDYGGEKLAGGTSLIVSAGVVTSDKKLPGKFKFYTYGELNIVPDENYDRMADFYRRFGISGIESHWNRGLPDVTGGDDNTLHQKMFEANRRKGVLNIANVSAFAQKYAPSYIPDPTGTMKLGGLIQAMDLACAGLESGEARDAWQKAHKYFDMILWDWEPHYGPQAWPGLEDKKAIDAFAEKNGIEEKLTPELLRETYREAYGRFRMEQISRPLYSMRKTIDSVKKMPFRVEQGGGAVRNIDYDVYGSDFEMLSPMIYETSPIGYAKNLTGMLASTKLPAKKFMPDMTIGWAFAKPFRETPRDFLLDTIVTAAAGCEGVAHWPGLFMIDGAWFGIHEGLTQIALVEDFYLNGKAVNTITSKGLAYREDTIDLGGGRKMMLPTPDWREPLVSFVHESKGDFLLTLLNYHQTEDAFVQISGTPLKQRYLINPVDKTYQMSSADGVAVVHVGKESPVLLIATANQAKTRGLQLIKDNTVQTDFQTVKDAYLKANRQSKIALGTVGAVTTSYNEIQFAETAQICLQVKTPEQTLWFGPTGGRVYDWQAKEMRGFVEKNDPKGGFAMDLLWLPDGARWSGDENGKMTLASCRNNGQEAIVVYEGAFTRGLPGVTMRKTYRVPASGTTLHIEITLRNGRVDETPVILSYWAHNVLAVAEMHCITDSLTHAFQKGQSAIFTAKDLPSEFKSHVISPNQITGTSGSVYAEFFPDRQAGLVFQLPENFMNVYRWSSPNREMCGSEWMSQPISLRAGAETDLKFSITAVPKATAQSLRKLLTPVGRPAAVPAKATDPENLLSCTFDKLNNGQLPDDYTLETMGENPDGAVISTEKDDSGAVAVRIDMSKESSAQINTARVSRLEPGKEYLLTVQVKIDRMQHYGNWYKDPRGVRIYVYGIDNRHVWLAIWGNGSTDGWITGFLPFSTAQAGELANPNVFFRCFNMTGTVRFRNPMILERPAGVEIKPGFELADGTRVMGSGLQLK